jgi:hypothetical protein
LDRFTTTFRHLPFILQQFCALVPSPHSEHTRAHAPDVPTHLPQHAHFSVSDPTLHPAQRRPYTRFAEPQKLPQIAQSCARPNEHSEQSKAFFPDDPAHLSHLWAPPSEVAPSVLVVKASTGMASPFIMRMW